MRATGSRRCSRGGGQDIPESGRICRRFEEVDNTQKHGRRLTGATAYVTVVMAPRDSPACGVPEKIVYCKAGMWTRMPTLSTTALASPSAAAGSMRATALRQRCRHGAGTDQAGVEMSDSDKVYPWTFRRSFERAHRSS